MCTSCRKWAGRPRSTRPLTRIARNQTPTPATSRFTARRKRRVSAARAATAGTASRLPSCMIAHTGGDRKPGDAVAVDQLRRRDQERDGSSQADQVAHMPRQQQLRALTRPTAGMLRHHGARWYSPPPTLLTLPHPPVPARQSWSEVADLQARLRRQVLALEDEQTSAEAPQPIAERIAELRLALP